MCGNLDSRSGCWARNELITRFIDKPSDVFSVFVRVITAAMVLFVEELR